MNYCNRQLGLFSEINIRSDCRTSIEIRSSGISKTRRIFVGAADVELRFHTNAETRIKKIFTAEVKKDSTKWSVKFRDWFVWTVQINNEKGTAGGNIKINFPAKSTFLIAVICIIMAILLRSLGVLVSIIFISFGVYHFRTWFIASKTRERALALKNIPLRRAGHRKSRKQRMIK